MPASAVTDVHTECREFSLYRNLWAILVYCIEVYGADEGSVVINSTERLGVGCGSNGLFTNYL